MFKSECTNACDSSFRGFQKKSVWERNPSCDKSFVAFKKAHFVDPNTIMKQLKIDFHELKQRACRMWCGVSAIDGIEITAISCSISYWLTCDLHFVEEWHRREIWKNRNPSIPATMLDAPCYGFALSELRYRVGWDATMFVFGFREIFFTKKVMAGISFSTNKFVWYLYTLIRY